MTFVQRMFFKTAVMERALIIKSELCKLNFDGIGGGIGITERGADGIINAGDVTTLA